MGRGHRGVERGRHPEDQGLRRGAEEVGNGVMTNDDSLLLLSTRPEMLKGHK